MSTPNTPATYPFTIRLTAAERALLEERAGEFPVGTYIKTLVFNDAHTPARRGRRSPVKDRRQLAELLACLGASRLSESLQRLAEAASNGSLYVDDRIRHQLRDACHDVDVMRQILMRALGVSDTYASGRGDGKESASQSFIRSAAPRPDQW